MEALMDTGAPYTWVPRPTLEELGYKPSFKRRLRLANGKVIERDGCEVVEIDGYDDRDLRRPGLGGAPRGGDPETALLNPDPVSKRFVSVEVFLIRVPALHL